jgi:cation:H+ antiporter
LVWVKFVLCLVIILFAGTKLVWYGDAIAEKTGLGRIWIGLVLLAAITSMPELVTGVSAAAPWVASPNLALGTLFGSCAINFAILALLDILHRRTPILSEASSEHMLSAGWGILLIAVAAGSVFAGERFSGLGLGWMGLPSILIFIFYLVAMWQIFRFERSHQLSSPQAISSQHEGISTKITYLRFALAAIAVIAAGIWLALIGDEIAEVTGWSGSFVGSLFLAITSSTPELVVSITALRLGAIDMAIADILGSNMFNIAIVAPVDLAYRQGSVFCAASPSHLITAATVVMMSLLVIDGLKFRQKRKIFVVSSWYSPILIGLYIFTAYALFTWSGGL